MSTMNIKIEGERVKPEDGNYLVEINCDDAIIIYSNITGAVMNPDQNGELSYTRKVEAWVNGLKKPTDVFTRLSQIVLRVFMDSPDQKNNEYNLVNFIQILITQAGLEGKVRLRLGEELIANSKEGQL